jgi:hypothetical protein
MEVYIDGERRLHLKDMWCVPATEAKYCVPQAKNEQPNSFGSLLLGGPNAASVVLDHVRVYDFAVPTGDLGAEAVCTNYGSCRDFGVLAWMPPEVPLIAPSHPFAPPSFRFVAGVLLAAIYVLQCASVICVWLLIRPPKSF